MRIFTQVDEAVNRRRAIEALRAGVPSRDAVAALGSGQSAIEDRFAEQRGTTTTTGTAGGLLIGGGFGSGKSHLLEHLAQLALDDGFVVSRVVISKETPLHDPAKVFLAAAEAAIAPGRSGPAIAEAAAELDVEARGYAELLRWAGSSAADLNERFPATLALYARIRERDTEFADAIVRFWSGDPISVPDLRRRIRDFGEVPVLPTVPVRELGRQRLRFAARLFAASGCAGWVILLDEVELIGRYSLQQRAKSYAEIAHWVRGEHGTTGLPIAAVLAMTDDFEAAVITERNDRDAVPAKLRAKDTAEAAELAGLAEQGMRIIDREMMLLTPPDAAELDQAYTRLKELHGTAFAWEPPDVVGLERLGATRMRQYIRAWINEWDLVRLDPQYQPETMTVDVSSDYREDSTLEETADANL